MTKKINIVGANPKKIVIVDEPKRRINPTELAAALGANPDHQQVPYNLDPIALAELGTQLLQRLRSSGGRPALSDAMINCRVPLSGEDIKTLEHMVSSISESTGARPSVGQLASVMVRQQLSALEKASEEPHLDGSILLSEPKGVFSACMNKPSQDSSWLIALNGRRQEYRQAQEVVQQAGTTWGKKSVA